MVGGCEVEVAGRSGELRHCEVWMIASWRRKDSQLQCNIAVESES